MWRRLLALVAVDETALACVVVFCRVVRYGLCCIAVQYPFGKIVTRFWLCSPLSINLQFFPSHRQRVLTLRPNSISLN